MKTKIKLDGFCGCLTIIIIFILYIGVVGTISGLCWPWMINSWLIHFNKVPAVHFWHGFLLGLVPVIGWIGLPGAALTWIIMLFL